MRIAMIGTGYVGLVSGACFADFGHHVTCVDKDAAKIAALARNEIPIFEPGLDRLVETNARGGRLSFSTASQRPSKAPRMFIAVGTPSRRGDGHADLSYVYAAAREIAGACPAPPSSSPNRRCRSEPARRRAHYSRGAARRRFPVVLKPGIPARRCRDPRLQASGSHRHRH